MAKDPAMLWYWSDWNSGTTTLSRFLKGCYMDLLHAQFSSGHLSIDEIQTVLASDFDKAWPTLKKKFTQDEDGLFFNERLDHEKKRRAEYTESRRKSRTKSDEDNVRIYLIKDNDTNFTKIGSSVNPERRFNEMLNQANPAITVGNRNYTLLWYSQPVERKMEKTIHDFFKGKRIKGEWFDLSTPDIDTLVRTFFNTSLRTIQRTENENENENRIVVEFKEGVQGEKTHTLPVTIPERQRTDNDSADFEDYEVWTDQVIKGNDAQFEQLIMKEKFKVNGALVELAKGFLSLLAQYPNKKPPDQHRFRVALIGHIRENINKTGYEQQSNKGISRSSSAQVTGTDYTGGLKKTTG